MKFSIMFLLVCIQMIAFAQSGSNCANSIPAILGSNTVDTITAPSTISAPYLGLGTKAIWYKFNCTQTAFYQVSTCGQGVSTFGATYRDCSLLTMVGIGSDECGNSTEYKFGGIAGQTYYIVWFSSYSAEGFDFTLSNVGPIENGDICLMTTPVSYGYNFVSSFAESNILFGNTFPNYINWYSFTPTSSGVHTITSNGGGDHFLFANDCNSTTPLSSVLYNNQTNTSTVTLTSGVTYKIALVGGSEPPENPYFLHIKKEEVATTSNDCSQALNITEFGSYTTGVFEYPSSVSFMAGANKAKWYYFNSTQPNQIRISSCGANSRLWILKRNWDCNNFEVLEVAENNCSSGVGCEIILNALAPQEYVFVFDNKYGNASINFTINEVTSVPSAGDNCENAILLSPNQSYAIDSFDYPADYYYQDLSSLTDLEEANNQHWYKLPSGKGYYDVSSCGTNEDTRVRIHRGDCPSIANSLNNSAIQDLNDDYCETASKINVYNNGDGSDYYVIWENRSGNKGFSFDFTEILPQENDICELATTLTDGIINIDSMVYPSFLSYDYLYYFGESDTLVSTTFEKYGQEWNGKWYKLTPTVPTRLQVSQMPPYNNVIMSVMKGSCDSPKFINGVLFYGYEWSPFVNVPADGDPAITKTWDIFPGATYYILFAQNQSFTNENTYGDIELNVNIEAFGANSGSRCQFAKTIVLDSIYPVDNYAIQSLSVGGEFNGQDIVGQKWLKFTAPEVGYYEVNVNYDEATFPVNTYYFEQHVYKGGVCNNLSVDNNYYQDWYSPVYDYYDAGFFADYPGEVIYIKMYTYFTTYTDLLLSEATYTVSLKSPGLPGPGDFPTTAVPIAIGENIVPAIDYALFSGYKLNVEHAYWFLWDQDLEPGQYLEVSTCSQNINTYLHVFYSEPGSGLIIPYGEGTLCTSGPGQNVGSKFKLNYYADYVGYKFYFVFFDSSTQDSLCNSNIEKSNLFSVNAFLGNQADLYLLPGNSCANKLDAQLGDNFFELDFSLNDNSFPVNFGTKRKYYTFTPEQTATYKLTACEGPSGYNFKILNSMCNAIIPLQTDEYCANFKKERYFYGEAGVTYTILFGTYTFGSDFYFNLSISEQLKYNPISFTVCFPEYLVTDSAYIRTAGSDQVYFIPLTKIPNTYQFEGTALRFDDNPFSYAFCDQNYYPETELVQDCGGFGYFNGELIALRLFSGPAEENITVESALYNHCYETCPLGYDTLTFQVDMSSNIDVYGTPTSPQGVYIGSDFQNFYGSTLNNYDFTTMPMTQVPGTNIYQRQFILPFGTYKYRYANGPSTANAETNTVNCENVSGAYRTITIPYDGDYIKNCYNICVDCENLLDTANSDIITFQVDMSVNQDSLGIPTSSQGVFIASDFQQLIGEGANFSYTNSQMTQIPGTNIYEKQCVLPNGNYKFRYSNGPSYLNAETNTIFCPNSFGSYRTITIPHDGSHVINCYDLCINCSEWVDTTVLGVSYNDFKSQFKLMPNPVQNKTLLSFGNQDTQLLKFSIHNSIGQDVSSLSSSYYESGKMIFDVQSLPIGVYFIVITNEIYTISLPLLKQ